jgi:hypothetical protein
VQILFFHEETDEEAVEPGEQVPIEKAEVVADDVVAVVGELDALTFTLAAALAFESAEKNLPRHQLELLETSEELGV